MRAKLNYSRQQSKTALLKTKIVLLFLIMATIFSRLNAQNNKPFLVEYDSITVGAQRYNLYLPELKNKKAALLVNHASLVGEKHLVDVLLAKEVNLVKIFSPEHGFRGNNDAGETVENGKDALSGLPIVSLYGKHKKPTSDDLQDVDILLVDLQDVGVRFYTYISTMSLSMEACAENKVKIIVLDRPNPNGYYVDGPVLKKAFSSFVGMHPVPVVYGMTIGEYAAMVNGEHWLKKGVTANLEVIPMKGYQRNMVVKLKVNPSPNLPNWKSVYLYPSLCFFEGTVVSVGRGTQYPFQVYGHPGFPFGDFSFLPQSIPGKSKHPKLQGKVCYGQYLAGYADNLQNNPAGIHLVWLISSYKYLFDKTEFFNNYFDKLAGTDELRKQIIEGLSQEEIKASWQPGLKEFLKVREKYLIYKPVLPEN